MSRGSSPRGLDQRRVILCVTGSIAAYKAAILARRLVQCGADLEVVLTRAAGHFVGAATFSGITGKRVHTDAFGADAAGELHIALAKLCELCVIAPASADLLARIAQGRADDLVGALALSVRCPLVIAPAMHPRMWDHPATRRNRDVLAREANVHFAGPVDGPVASGDEGVGRMAEPEAILGAVLGILGTETLARQTLRGKRIIVTAGPTHEAIDPVRFLSNRSSGKLGFAVAREALARGAEVVLLAGPVALETPPGAIRYDVESALELRDRLKAELGSELAGAHAVIMAAAVGDYRALDLPLEKLSKLDRLELKLSQNPDIIAEIGARRTAPQPLLVAFALESAAGGELIERARQKLTRKRVDAIVANHTDAMGDDSSAAILVTKESTQELPHQGKDGIARAIVDWVQNRLEKPTR